MKRFLPCVFVALCLAPNIQAFGSEFVAGSCGLPSATVYSLRKRERGPVNGGYDENKNGTIETEEAFTRWDFNQIHDVMQYGSEANIYQWTNIDTCYQFTVMPSAFQEDPSNDPLWRTCRRFYFVVRNAVGDELVVGTTSGYACRNFATRRWMIVGD